MPHLPKDIPGVKQSLSKVVVGEFEKFAGLESTNIKTVCPIERLDPSANAGYAKAPTHAIAIGLTKESTHSLDSITSIIVNCLRKIHHFGFEYLGLDQTNQIALQILAMAVLSQKRGDDVFGHIDYILGTISEATATQVCAIAHPPVDASVYRFGEFQYGWIDSDRIEKLTLKAGSTDYFKLHSKLLVSKTGMMRERKVTLVDAWHPYFSNTFDRLVEPQKTQLYRILDTYFHDLALILWKDFFIQLDIQQAKMAAAGGGYLPARMFDALGRSTHRVSIFHREQNGHGWVAPVGTFLTAVLPAATSLSVGQACIDEGLRLSDFGRLPLDHALQMYSSYIFSACEYYESGRLEEALVHCIFALDSLLGGKSNESLTVIFKERIASLTSIATGDSPEELSRFANSCYDFRSNYAHRGIRNNDSAKVTGLLDRLMVLGQIVFASGCWARRQERCSDLDCWLMRIDVLRVKNRARLNANDEIVQLGLNRINSKLAGGQNMYVLDWT